MLILTNCLTETADEGCLKVANSLIKRIKKAHSGVTIISYERQTKETDIYLEINKFLISGKLFSVIKKRKEPVLYMPFPARTTPTALRIFNLSFFSRRKPNVVLTMKSPYGFFGKLLLRLSKANLIVFSKDAYDFYVKIVGQKRVAYLKTGVDTEKFIPVSKEEQRKLKQKYGFNADKPIVLHVGHLNQGRNVGQLLKISNEYQVVLVTSTLTKEEQDLQLRKELSSHSNITIMDEYIPNIQEIYQLSDVYFFPVLASGHCIDVPLSCMEAAACNKPILTTAYGEMKELIKKDGFSLLNSFEEGELNKQIEKSLMLENCCTRQAVLECDWNNAIDYLIDLK